MKRKKKELAENLPVGKDGEYSHLLHGADVKGCRVEVLASEKEMAKILQSRFADAGAQEVETSYLEEAPVGGKTSRRLTDRPKATRSVGEIPSVEDMPVHPSQQDEPKETARAETEETPEREEDSDKVGKKEKKRDFAYFKRTVNRRAALVALLFGVCCALVAIGVTLIVLKSSALILRPDLYFLFGGALAFVGWLVFFLCARQGDKKLAVKMDKTYHLGESVQTMVENAKKESGIIQLQRESTNEKISKITWKKATGVQIAALVLAPVLALGVLVTGLAVPQKVIAAPIPEENLPSDIGKNQINELKKLIQNVGSDKELFKLQAQTAALEEGEIPPLTKKYLTSLNELLDTAEGYYEQKESGGETWTNQQRKDAVTAAMTGVITATEPYVSYRKISSALKENESVAVLGTSLYGAGKAYTTGKSYTYAFVKAQAGETLGTAVMAQVEKACHTMTESFAELSYAQYGLQTLGYQNAILQSIASLAVDAEDALLVAVDTLADNFGILSTMQVTEGNVATFREYLNHYVVGAFEAEAAEILYEQSYYSLMEEYICDTLSDVFDVEIPKNSESDDDGNEGGDGNEEDGRDDFEHNKFPDWPSSDLIIDVNGEKVHYGEILNEGNYAKILALSQMEGLPQELKDYVEKYLNEIKSSEKTSD